MQKLLVFVSFTMLTFSAHGLVTKTISVGQHRVHGVGRANTAEPHGILLDHAELAQVRGTRALQRVCDDGVIDRTSIETEFKANAEGNYETAVVGNCMTTDVGAQGSKSIVVRVETASSYAEQVVESKGADLSKLYVLAHRNLDQECHNKGGLLEAASAVVREPIFFQRHGDPLEVQIQLSGTCLIPIDN